MKVAFRKKGIINDQYTVMEHCCDYSKYIKVLDRSRKSGVFFWPRGGGGVVMNYCGSCGSKTEIVGQPADALTDTDNPFEDTTKLS